MEEFKSFASKMLETLLSISREQRPEHTVCDLALMCQLDIGVFEQSLNHFQFYLKNVKSSNTTNLFYDNFPDEVSSLLSAMVKELECVASREESQDDDAM